MAASSASACPVPSTPRSPDHNAGPGRDVLRLLLALWCVGAVLMLVTDVADGAVTLPAGDRLAVLLSIPFAFVAVRAVVLAAIGMGLDAALLRLMKRPVGQHALLRI